MSWQLAGAEPLAPAAREALPGPRDARSRPRAPAWRRAPARLPAAARALLAEAPLRAARRRCGCAAARAAGRLLWLHGGAYCLGSPRTHAADGRARWRGGPDWRARCPTTGSRPSTPSRPPSRTRWRPGRRCAPRARPPGRIALGGDSAGGGLAFALAAPPARRRRAAAGLRRRLQPLGRPDPVGREPHAASPGATPSCPPRASPRSATCTSPAPIRATRAPRRISAASPARRRCSSRRAAPRSCATTRG